MKFVFPPSLLQGACSWKVSKNLKIEGDQVTLPKSDLATLGTYGPLGVKGTSKYFGLILRYDIVKKVVQSDGFYGIFTFDIF
jgi:hypothetical protein